MSLLWIRRSALVGQKRTLLAALAALTAASVACANDVQDSQTGASAGVPAGVPAETPKGEETAPIVNPVKGVHYREYTNETLALIDIGKRLMGLDPAANDALKNYGMINIADALGYAYASDGCNSGWTASFSKGEVSATADHTRPAPNCGDQNYNTSVGATYKFSEWYVDEALTYVTPHPFTAGERKPEPRNSESTHQDVEVDEATGSVTIRERNMMNVDSGYNGTTGPVTMHTGFSNSIAIAHAVTASWSNATEVGVTVTVGGKIGLPLVAEGTVSVAVGVKNTTTVGGSTTDTTTTTQTPSCTFDIPVPAGCHYTGTVTALVTRERRRYWADVTMAPKLASIHGFMRYEQGGGCQHRDFRNKDGKCPCNEDKAKALGGDCSGARATFQTNFGGSTTGMSFIEDIGRQRERDAGKWYWAGAAAASPGLDQAIAALKTDVSRYQFSLPFEFANDKILTCTLETRVEPDSTGTCAPIAPQQKPAGPVTKP